MKVFNLQLLASAPLFLSSTDGFAPVVRNKSPTTKTKTTTTTTILQATIGDTGVAFENVTREWRCKYSPGPSGGPGDSKSLKACQSLLEEFVPQVQELLPSATITRQVVCGGCLDFKVSISQPLAEHGVWSDANYSPLEEEFMSKLTKIDGTSVHETQDIIFQTLLQGGTQVQDTLSQGLVDANFGLVDAQIKQGKRVVDAQIKAELEGAASILVTDDSESLLVDEQIQGATKAITEAVDAQIQEATTAVAEAADDSQIIQGAKQAIADSKRAMDAFDEKMAVGNLLFDASVKEAKKDIRDKLSSE